MKKLFVLVTLIMSAAPGAFAYEYDFEPTHDCIPYGPKDPPAYPPLCEVDGITYKGYWSMNILGCWRAHCVPAPLAPEGV